VNKVLLRIGGEPIIVRSARALAASPSVDELVVVAAPSEVSLCGSLLAKSGIHAKVISGGATRHGSEWAALRHLERDICEGRIEIVVIHDAARPFFPSERLTELIDAARVHRGALFGLPTDGCVARVQEGRISRRLAASDVWAAQTPQAFHADTLLQAYRRAAEEGFEGTDTSSTVERLGVRPLLLRGDPVNIKVTYAEDIVILEGLWEYRRRRTR
jgi:2-C-methyl-D-erythritol 4-phosphate cytidylyltransferase